MPRISKRKEKLHTLLSGIQTATIMEGLRMVSVMPTANLHLAGCSLPISMWFMFLFWHEYEDLSKRRYIPGSRSSFVPKSSAWMRRILPAYDSARRAAFVRVSDEVFENILQLIEEHSGFLFKNRKGPSQLSKRLQVAIGLTRLGCYGNAASIGRIAALFGVGEGMVSKASARTITALQALAPHVIKWPTREKRITMSKYAADMFGFKGAIGSVDGTTIPLYKAPAIRPWNFFDKKSRYSLHVLVTVTHDYRVIDLLVGFLGPAPDSVVQREAFWQIRPETFFREEEYLLGDKGMYMTVQCVIPYKGDAAAGPDNANFNWQLARLRIVAEQVIGQVKGRFAALRELRVQIEQEEDIRRCGEWIIAGFVLHNLCIDHNDYVPPRTANAYRCDQISPDSVQAAQDSSAHISREKVKTAVLQFMKDNNTYLS